jgi:nucleoside-diphosphate-sugar epimerase
MAKVGIIGLGWLGEKIAEALSAKHSIYSTTTSIEKSEQLNIKGLNPKVVRFSEELMDAPTLWKDVEELDILIITVPFSERVNSFDHLSAKIKALSQFIGKFKGQMFFMSSTSVYPNLPNEFAESDLPTESVVSERLIKEIYPQINILRLAGLMGGDRLLMKYKVSDLDHPVNHIHYSDVCAVIERMIELRSESQLYNVVAPMHPTKQEVIDAQKNTSNKGIAISEGRKISCLKLMSELDFEFKYPDPRLFHVDNPDELRQ